MHYDSSTELCVASNSNYLATCLDTCSYGLNECDNEDYWKTQVGNGINSCSIPDSLSWAVGGLNDYFYVACDMHGKSVLTAPC